MKNLFVFLVSFLSFSLSVFADCKDAKPYGDYVKGWEVVYECTSTDGKDAEDPGAKCVYKKDGKYQIWFLRASGNYLQPDHLSLDRSNEVDVLLDTDKILQIESTSFFPGNEYYSVFTLNKIANTAKYETTNNTDNDDDGIRNDENEYEYKCKPLNKL